MNGNRGTTRFALGRLGWPVLVGLLALVAIYAAVRQLESASQGLRISAQHLGSTPVTVFRPASAAAASSPSPVVLVAHGFAGSQQLMQPVAITLARNGYTAITFDFPGHGRNTEPMLGGLNDPDRSLETLLASMDEMGRFASRLAADDGGTGRYAVLGHSMASDIVVRHAQSQAKVQATAGISLFAPSIKADTPGDSPRNLLIIDGAWEPDMMAQEALRVISRVAGPGAQHGTTYGDFDTGTARRSTLSPGAEHISVLYNRATLAESLAWFDAAFQRPAQAAPFIDARGAGLGLLLLGVVGLAWPLAQLLPRITPRITERTTQRTSPGPTHSALPPARLRWWSWRGQAPITLVPAVVTPLVLWPLPSEFMPLLLGDYLVLHFALYGLLTWAVALLLGRRPAHLPQGRLMALIGATLATTAYALMAVGLPIDRYVFNVHPEALRLPLIAIMCAGTLPYFLADEWLTRDPTAAPGAYLASKCCFLLSLVAAIALNPPRLFFLAIIVPAILLMFVIYGLFSRWVFRRTGQATVAALANALTFGCFIAVTFPLVA